MVAAIARFGALGLIVLAQASQAFAQASTGPPGQPASASPPAWSFDASMTAYVFLEDGDFGQPSFAAHRGALTLEARFNDVAVRSFSGFAGWQFASDRTIAIELVPKLGVAFGTIDAVIPALEFALSFRRLEFSGEGQFVIDVHENRQTFLYSWTELSFRAPDWLRLGMAAQRTRAFDEPRDIQRGVLAGVTFGRVDGTIYWFNPDSDRRYVVASLAVTFGS